MPEFPRFHDVGEAALVVEFGETVDAELNRQVLALDRTLGEAGLAGVRELVPTYRSLMIHYEPLILPREMLIAKVEILLSAGRAVQAEGPARRWQMPCCYEPPFGEDVDEVACLTRMSRDEVIAAHLAGTYRIYMYGFAPAYCYLGGLVPALQIARRAKPRAPHQAGAVLIGGGLASVSTFAMPTGWYVLGRTPARLYAPGRPDPFALRPGDHIVFRAVSAEAFEELEDAAGKGAVIVRELANADGTP